MKLIILNIFLLPVVKQRMQMCCSPYTSCSQAAYSIFRAEGARAFYRSYGTQLTMNIPFQVGGTENDAITTCIHIF